VGIETVISDTGKKNKLKKILLNNRWLSVITIWLQSALCKKMAAQTDISESLTKVGHMDCINDKSWSFTQNARAKSTRLKLPSNPVVNRKHHEFFGTSVKMKGQEKDRDTEKG
jgi:hypothetical protein